MAFFTTIAKEDMDTSTDGAPDIDAMNDADLAIAEGTDISDAAADDIEVANEELDDASDALDGLNDVGDHIQDSIDSGEGMTEREAEGMEIAVEQIARRLGIQPGKRFMPAKESFGGRNDRLRASKVAKEGVTDFIKKVWEGILKFIRMIRDKVKQFFFGLTKNIEGLLTQSSDLKAQVNKLSVTGKHKNDDLDNKSIASAFSVDQKADFSTAKTIISNVKTLDQLSKGCGPREVDFAEGLKKMAETFSQGKVEDAEYAKVFAEKIKDTLNAKEELHKAIEGALSSIGTIKATGKVKGVDKSVWENADIYGPFVHSKVLIATNADKLKKKHTEELAELNKKYFDRIGGISEEEKSRRSELANQNKEASFKATVKFEELDGRSSDKIKALARNEMLEILKLSDEVLTIMESAEKSGKIAEKVSDVLEKSTEEVLKTIKATPDTSAMVSVAIREAQNSTKECNAAVKAISSDSSSLMLEVVKRSHDYVRASINNWETK